MNKKFDLADESFFVFSKRILKSALDPVEYRHCVLVNDYLEMLDTFKIEVDKELRDRWYSLWLPLEIRNATGERDWSPDAAREVEVLRSYIYDALNAEAPPRI